MARNDVVNKDGSWNIERIGKFHDDIEEAKQKIDTEVGKVAEQLAQKANQNDVTQLSNGVANVAANVDVIAETASKVTSKRGKYVVVGDSLSAGTPALQRDMPTWLSFKLGQTVINKGVWGNTLSQVYERLDSDVVSYKPKYSILLVGTNNINSGNSDSHMREYINLITDKLKENNIEPVWLAIPPRTDNASHRQKIIDYNYWLQHFCKINGLLFVDIYSPLLNNEESVLSVKSGVLLEDLLHLTADGHRTVAEKVYESISTNKSIHLPKISGGDVNTTVANNRFYIYSNYPTVGIADGWSAVSGASPNAVYTFEEINYDKDTKRRKQVITLPPQEQSSLAGIRTLIGAGLGVSTKKTWEISFDLEFQSTETSWLYVYASPMDNNNVSTGETTKCLFGAEATSVNRRIRFEYTPPVGTTQTYLIIQFSGKEFTAKVSQLNIHEVTQAIVGDRIITTGDFVKKGNGSVVLSQDPTEVINASAGYTNYMALLLAESIKKFNFYTVKSERNYLIIAANGHSKFVAVELSASASSRVYELSEAGVVSTLQTAQNVQGVAIGDNISVYDDGTNFVFIKNGLDWFKITKSVIPTGYTQQLGFVYYHVGGTTQIARKLRDGIYYDVNAFSKRYIADGHFTEKVLTLLGDSITQGTGLTASEKPYHSLLKDELGFGAVNNLGVHGTEISTGGTWGPSTAFVSRYTQIPTNSDYIIVFGGTNDYLHNVTLGTIGSTDNLNFYGALNNLILGLYDRYSNARIIFVTPIRTFDTITGKTDKQPNTKGHTLTDYVNALKEVCAKYSVPVVDLHTTAGFLMENDKLRTKLTTDGIHPNQYGHQRIANIIQSNLITYK